MHRHTALTDRYGALTNADTVGTGTPPGSGPRHLGEGREAACRTASAGMWGEDPRCTRGRRWSQTDSPRGTVRPWPLDGSNSVPISPIVDQGRRLYLGPD